VSELDVAVVLEALASPVHPGAAGSAAALTGAMSAALVAKAARAAGEEAAASQAIALAIKLERLAAIDADALAAARAALADADEGGDARRDFRLGLTLSQAAAVPLDVAEACVDVIDLAGLVAGIATDDLLPDVRAAGSLAAAGARAAAHLVEVNLSVGSDDPRAQRAREAARRAAGELSAPL
jgi:formiminotetrahydrofolate cyclodeaminase